jgi:hypothetical protein
VERSLWKSGVVTIRGTTLACWIYGHVDSRSAQEYAQQMYEIEGEVRARHTYLRAVPDREVGMALYESSRGRGAWPATVVETDGFTLR